MMMSNKPFVMVRYPYIPYILAGPPCTVRVPDPSSGPIAYRDIAFRAVAPSLPYSLYYRAIAYRVIAMCGPAQHK